jgi:xylan 1,4-beta-xylosidase
MDRAPFHCDLSQAGSPLKHFWEHTVGSCHAPLALRRDWQEQLRRCHAELGFRYVRFHGLFGDDMSTLVSHQGRLVYSFFNADAIVDFLLSIGMKPFVELSFMPGAIASGADTVFRYRGNITPPREYGQWAELIRRLARHWVERYGREEVRQWYFEVWNEPNLKQFWAGSQKDYFELYRATVQALIEIDAEVAVGGPATAKEEWIDEFLAFCEQNRLPVDFVSTHHYPNDVLWFEDQDTETQLANSRRCSLRDGMREARRQVGRRPLFYTEWNCSSNPRYPPQDEPYAAAFAVKTVLEAAGLVDCYSFWTFTDIFEENYFPSLPFHGGFGLLNLHGIAKPVYRAFQLLHRLGDELLPVVGRHATADVWVVRGPGMVMVMCTNHQLPRQPIEPVHVELRLTGTPPPCSATVERIDDRHANAKLAWVGYGRPEYLDRGHFSTLEELSLLRSEPLEWHYENQAAVVQVELPPQGVAALTLDFWPP